MPLPEKIGDNLQTLVTIVVPAYNEEENLKPLYDRITQVLADAVTIRWDMLIIDDGSQDNTLGQLRQMHRECTNVHYISFSRNFGHQAALKAGLDKAQGDAVISMDADLQHPPDLLPELIQHWKDGAEVVYTLRQDDRKIPFLKRITSQAFYHVFNLLSGIKLDTGTSDFRLLDRKVVDTLKAMPESGLFLRGIMQWIGYRQVAITFTVGQRHSGVSKYSLTKMLRLAADGVFAFSHKPLRFASFIGCCVSLFAAVYAVYALAVYFFTNTAISGWTSILLSLLFLGGMQLLSIGLVGEYLARTLVETKRRPHYIISESK